MEISETEHWFCWKVYETPEGEDKPRLLTPHSDPNLYEQPLNGVFNTPEEAIDYLKVFGEEKGEYHLCHIMISPLGSFTVDDEETLTHNSDQAKV